MEMVFILMRFPLSLYLPSICFPYGILSAFAGPVGLSCRTIKLLVTFLVEEVSRNGAAKQEQFQETLYFTHLPRDVREVSSFEAKKGTVEHQLDSRWAI